MTALQQLLQALNEKADKDKATVLQRYFKTGKGEYAEGDVFIGITVPEQRKLAKLFYNELKAEEIEILLKSKIHEHRLTALFVLVLQFSKAKSEASQEAIINLYLKHKAQVNNWDLVDSSAPYLLGAYLHHKPKTLLYDLATSNQLWCKRMAIVATYYSIRKNSFDDTFAIAQRLLHHPHDLIHKATGWMLREVANRDDEAALTFLVRHYQAMPRTMLRHAIEKFPPPLKEQFMKGVI